MRLFRISLMASAIAVVFSGIAVAQSAASYDGTYIGVSGTVNNTRCLTAQTPGPLTIANGNAVSNYFTGTVDGSGHVVLHTKENSRFDGQIDGTGVLKAGGAPPQCAYSFVWKKR
jgi:hypothetical protein